MKIVTMRKIKLQYMKIFDIWKQAANITSSFYIRPSEQSNGNCFLESQVERDTQISSSFNREENYDSLVMSDTGLGVKG